MCWSITAWQLSSPAVRNHRRKACIQAWSSTELAQTAQYHLCWSERAILNFGLNASTFLGAHLEEHVTQERNEHKHQVTDDPLPHTHTPSPKASGALRGWSSQPQPHARCSEPCSSPAARSGLPQLKQGSSPGCSTAAPARAALDSKAAR